MSSHSLSKSDLAYFTGSVHQFQHPLYKFLYTEGVRHVAQHGGAWWLLDAIASWVGLPGMVGRTDDLVVWRLEVRREAGEVWGAAALTARTEASGVLVSQEIESTDFPLGEIVFWLYDGVLMLPSEW